MHIIIRLSLNTRNFCHVTDFFTKYLCSVKGVRTAKVKVNGEYAVHSKSCIRAGVETCHKLNFFKSFNYLIRMAGVLLKPLKDELVVKTDTKDGTTDLEYMYVAYKQVCKILSICIIPDMYMYNTLHSVAIMKMFG